MDTITDHDDSSSERRRQLRSVATRRRILDAAVGLFAAQGYAHTETREIIARSGMTGGAFYHHFDDKDSVAEAILLQTNAEVLRIFTAADAGGPALESVIRGTIEVAHLHVRDAGARVSSQLMHTVGRVTGHAGRHFDTWATVLTGHLERGQAQGDVRAEVDPVPVGRAIASATYGAWAVASFRPDPRDIVDRLAGVWDVMLPAIVVPEVEAFLRDFLRRQRRSGNRQLPAVIAE